MSFPMTHLILYVYSDIYMSTDCICLVRPQHKILSYRISSKTSADTVSLPRMHKKISPDKNSAMFPVVA